MHTYYFTYGCDEAGTQPYKGGWTEITAPNEKFARQIHGMIHGCDPNEGLRFAFCYSEEDFIKTSMYRNGNFGKRCVERITFTHETF